MKKSYDHTFIYFCEFSKSDIESVLEFFYLGEVTVYVENLKNFFNCTKLLQIEGINVDPVERLIKDDVSSRNESVKEIEFKTEDFNHTGDVKLSTKPIKENQSIEQLLDCQNSISLSEIVDESDINTEDDFLETFTETSGEKD